MRHALYSSADQNRKTRTICHNWFQVEYETDEARRLIWKRERHSSFGAVYTYCYDASGRLTQVMLNDAIQEAYRYNAAGQRVFQTIGTLMAGALIGETCEYNEHGLLTRIVGPYGTTVYAYDERDALAAREDERQITQFVYDSNLNLREIVSPRGERIAYAYDTRTGRVPSVKYRNGRLSETYEWDWSERLIGWRDFENGLEYVFTYAEQAILDRVTIAAMSSGGFSKGSGEENHVDKLGVFRNRSNPMELRCCCDQAGTPRLLALDTGYRVKEMGYSSFGVPLVNTFPELFLPVGFAGGLRDRDMDLLRFGSGMYDPAAGRFMTPVSRLKPGRDPSQGGCRLDGPVGHAVSAGVFYNNEDFDESKVKRDRLGRFAKHKEVRALAVASPSGNGEILSSEEILAAEKRAKELAARRAIVKEEAKKNPHPYSPPGDMDILAPGTRLSPDSSRKVPADTAKVDDKPLSPQDEARKLAAVAPPGYGEMPSSEQIRAAEQFAKEHAERVKEANKDLYAVSPPGDVDFTSPEMKKLVKIAQEQLEKKRAKLKEDNLTLGDSLLISLANLDLSTWNFVKSLTKTFMDPWNTLSNIGAIYAGYMCQLQGWDSKYRVYADAVTDYIQKRYTSYDGLKRAFAEDPIGVLSDISIPLSLGGSTLVTASKYGSQLSSVVKASTITGAVADGLGKVGKGLQKAGSAIDPLNTSAKVASKVIPDNVKKASPIRQKYAEKIPKWVTRATRAAEIAGVAADTARKSSKVGKSVGPTITGIAEEAENSGNQ